MTREEAIREIMFAKRNVIADSYIDKAYDMAIKSLEAWEKVKEEIADLKYNPCCNYSMVGQNIAYDNTLEIIDKHLKEVEK